MNNSKKMTTLAIKALEDKKGNDIRVIDIQDVSIIADYFIIASGSNRNQVQTMADNVEEILEKAVFSLPKNEKKVIERKFGLFGHTKMTNQEISVDTGIPSNMINYYFKKGVRCISKNASLLSWWKS